MPLETLSVSQNSNSDTQPRPLKEGGVCYNIIVNYLFSFILGTIVGSFLNVVALRWDLPYQGSILSRFRGRSQCPHCGKKLSWTELVPILSFFILKAKCRECQASISYQYPLVELWTGLVFVFNYLLFGITLYSLLITLVFCIYIVITIYDFKYKIIPDSLVYFTILLTFMVRFISGGDLLDWLTGPIFFIFFGSIWFLSGGRAMGFGDAKLGLSVGLLLGALQGFSAMVLAFWIGAFISLLYIFLNNKGFIKSDKKLTMKSEIPFAPFIIIGAWVSVIFQLNLFHALSF